MQDPTREDYDKSQVESRLLEVDELTTGDIFAEYSAILKEPIQFSVVTVVPTEVFVVDIHDFFCLGRKMAEAFLGFSKVIPDDVTLRRALIETIKWNMFKRGIIKSVKANALNTR